VQEPRIHQRTLERAFSRASATYDLHAVLQREIADRLLAHMEFTTLKPKQILDIGCGTGYLTGKLRKRFRRAHLYGLDLAEGMVKRARSVSGSGGMFRSKGGFLQADAVLLPFPDACFDLVCSNLTMQWVSDPMTMLAEMRRVLAPGGLMLFSTFGKRTLAELRQSLASIDTARAGLVLPFPDVTSLGNALMELPVELPVTDSDLFNLTYPDFTALVRELKNLGASSAAISHRPGGLYGRGLLKELGDIYRQNHSQADGRIHASFEALYAQAWYAKPGFQHASGVIPIVHAGLREDHAE